MFVYFISCSLLEYKIDQFVFASWFSFFHLTRQNMFTLPGHQFYDATDLVFCVFAPLSTYCLTIQCFYESMKFLAILSFQVQVMTEI